jgi:hypothetical protein
LNVSTLIWSTFSDGSSKIAAFTLVVIAESSKYSPELSRVGVDAHPRNAVTNVMQTRKRNIRCLFTMMLSPLVWFVHERHVSKAPIPDIPWNTHMLILSDGLGYRHLSETRIAVCPNFGSVFVLWQEYLRIIQTIGQTPV